jgi:hypothetical protein
MPRPFAIRTGHDYLTDDESGWTDDPAKARRFGTREMAEQVLDDIAAALEDGIDDPLEIVPIPILKAGDWAEEDEEESE